MSGSFFKNGALIESLATTATAGGTTTLVAGSSTNQQFTGTLAQSVVLPDATTLSVGRKFVVLNRASNTITIKYNGGSTLTTAPASTSVTLRLISNGTTDGVWDVDASASAGTVASSLPMVGSSPGDTLDSAFVKIDAELAKLFEDRNPLLMDGGLIAFAAAGTSVTFSEALKLHVNSRVAGGSPVIVDLTATTRNFSASGRMFYAVIDRVAGTATMFDDQTTLPAVTSANQEVFLIAKRLDSPGGNKRLYFRDGTVLQAGLFGRLGSLGGTYTGEFHLRDSSDPTKQTLFANGGSTTATQTVLQFTQTANRTISFPDATDTLVGKATTDVFTNKTLDFLRQSVATDSTTTGASTSLAAFTTGIVRLTNASLSSLSAIPAGVSGQYLIVENKTGNTITVNNEDTGLTAANRILTGTAANITVVTDATLALIYDSTSQRWQIVGGTGSGSGSAGINYASVNPNAEAGTAGWVTYSDVQTTTITNASPAVLSVGSTIGMYVGMPVALTTTGTLPTGLTASTTYFVSEVTSGTQYKVSATRGGANINTSSAGSGTHSTRPLVPASAASSSLTGLTFSRNTTTPLRGTGDFKLAQTNSTVVAGQGVYWPFTIDSADKARVLQVSFDFNADTNFVTADGTTAPNAGGNGDSDLEWFILDVTNAVIVPMTPQVIVAKGSNNFAFAASFQTASNSTSYRLCCHAAKTTAAATGYNFRWDNVVVGPSSKSNESSAVVFQATATGQTNYGAGVTTPWTLTSVRDTYGAFNGTTSYVIPVTGDYTIAFMADGAFSASAGSSGANAFMGGYVYKNGVLLKFSNIRNQATGTFNSWYIPIVFSDRFTAGDIITVNTNTNFTTPGTGGGGTLSISKIASGTSANDGDGRVVTLSVQGSSTVLASGSNTQIVNPTVTYDSHGGYNSSTGLYTVPVAGFYDVYGYIGAAGSAGTANAAFIAVLFKNGSQVFNGPSFVWNTTVSLNPSAAITCSIQCNAGDTLALSGRNTTASPITLAGGNNSTLMISRRPGSGSIAPTDAISMKYNNLNGVGSIGTSVNYKYVTRVWDTHTAYDITTGDFTAPVGGRYRVTHSHYGSGSPYSYISVNGSSEVARLGLATNVGEPHSSVIMVNAGDKISVKAAGVETVTADGAPYNYLIIEKVP